MQGPAPRLCAVKRGEKLTLQCRTRRLWAELSKDAKGSFIDLRELAIFVPLIVGTIWLGVQPGLVLDYTAASVDAVVGGWRLATGG